MEAAEPEALSTSPVQALLEELHARHSGDRSGEVASYIPELSTADPDWFGICVVTAGGATYEVGDTRREFTIQSISKPLTFALALEAIGEEAVRRHVDVEPSGEAFNSITLRPGTGIPLNPMVNAGAIATSSLIEPLGFEAPIDRILNEYAAFAGRELKVDEAVFESENRSGDRNRAIAYLMKNSGALPEDSSVEDVVETYFRQCSTLVDCRDLATMAATLASNGVNPVTGERAVREDTVRNVLSVMASCGMYDAAGDWLYNVGLPAKSGVAGGIIAVLPGQLGIAIYSPPLDEHGNSVRGVRVCEELSAALHLHVMSPPRRPAPPVRATHSCVESRSKKLRSPSEQAVLNSQGGKVRAVELQGEINFAAGELISGALLKDCEALEYAVVDFGAVRDVDPVVIPIISGLVEAFEGAGGQIAFSETRRLPSFVEELGAWRERQGLPPVRLFRDLDVALEWTEQGLLADSGLSGEDGEMPLSEHGATWNLSEAQLENLAGLLEHREYETGTLIYGEDDPVTEILLVTRGTINVLGRDPDGEVRRFATLSAGMSLGEIAMLGHRGRIGYSEAAGDVAAWALTEDAYDRLREQDPATLTLMLENMMRILALRIEGIRSQIAR
jgi:glutaminase